MLENFLNLLDPMTIIKTLGLVGILCIVFAESGLFFGFFLPGESLLFTAGFLASQNYLDINFLVWGCFICAVLGDNVGYWFGKKIGPKIFYREDSLFFHKKHIQNAQIFYERYGNKTIFLARFVPIIRTFAPIVAGVGNMNYKNFITYNLVGGFVWSFGMVYLGYFLGQIIPGVDKYIVLIVILIIIISLMPLFLEFLKFRRKK